MDNKEIIGAVLVILLFPLFWWGNVRLMACLSGWQRMAERFPAEKRQPKNSVWGKSAKIGWAKYKACVSIESSVEGIYLAVMFPFSFGHKPIFIPREEMREVKEKKFLWIERVRFEVGSPRVGRVELSKNDFEGRE